jgi:hypothetical protein
LRSRELLIGAGVLAIVSWFAVPATPWEFDEILFLQGVQHYDPVAHHPPPPGYPLFMLAGKIAALFAADDYRALIALNFLATIAGFVLLAMAFSRIADDVPSGVAGALLFYFCPAMLVHSTLAMSDPGALALLAATLFVTRAAPLGALAALTIGWRPQFAIIVVPLLFARVVMIREWRKRAIAVGVFALVCLAWLIPLAISVGGVDRLVRFESSQAGYLAEHDADVSRSGWTAPMIALRFIAHPWGTKVMSIPVLLLACAGVWRMVRRRDYRFLPLAIAALLYLAFALRFMDPADGVRYALPFVLGTAFFAGAGLTYQRRADSQSASEQDRLESRPYVFVVASLIYVSSLISQRAGSESPPFRAARFANFIYPPNSVVLYELSLWPHAQVFFAHRERMRVNDGLTQLFDRPDVPLFLYADGISHAPGARTFRWQPSDAYSKLTRNHYRVVSIIAVPPQRRFRVIRGVYVPEREADGDEWRWLDSPAEIQLPHGPPRSLTLRVGLPVIYPMEVNTLTIFVDGVSIKTVDLHRGRRIDVVVPVPQGAPVLRFEAGRAFVPAQVPGSLNRDPRRLAVKLYDLWSDR